MVAHLSHIDLNLLPVLNAILHEKNLTKAGKRLGMSQPAMSNALGRLRLMFGDELLIRYGREYRLSRLAMELVEPVDKVLQLADYAISKKQAFDPSKDRKHFRIASTDYASFLVLMPFIRYIEEHAPGLIVTIRRYSLESSVDQLDLGELDLVIAGRDPSTEFPKQPLYEDRWVCVAWKNFEDLDTHPTTPAQLKSLRRISYYWDVNNLTVPHLPWVDPEKTFVRNENDLLTLFMLRGTSSIAMTSEKIAHQLGELLELKILQPKFELPVLRQGMYWNASNTESPSHQWLRDTLLKIASEL